MPIRKKAPYIIFKYFSKGWTPKKIIEKGYSMATTYKYHKLWFDTLEEQFLKETGAK
jgi:hypothetical protein